MIAPLFLAALLALPEVTVRPGAPTAIVGVPLPIEVDVTGIGRATVVPPREGEELGSFVVVRASVDAGGAGAAGSSRLVLVVLPTRPGDLELPPFALRLEDRAGRERSVPVTATPIRVASALAPGEEPALRDSFDLVPFEAKAPLREWLAASLLLLALCGLVAWRARRRRAARKRAEAVRHRPVAGPPEDPTREALARLRALRLEAVAGGEDTGDRAAAAADAVRRWLDARIGGRLLARTTDELEPPLESVGGTVPLGDLLADADRVKYAARSPSRERLLAALDLSIAWFEAKGGAGGGGA